MRVFFHKIMRLLPAYRMGNAMRRENEEALQHLENRLNQLDYKMEYLFWLLQQEQGEEISETKERVFSSLPEAQGELRLIQKMNLSLLRAVKTVCDENAISFYLMNGTLLGAIRHKGFIPWDDDVDIAILRKDSQTLENVLKNHPSLSMERYYSTMDEKFVKIKFRDSDTFFLDVFILDAFDADENVLNTRYQAIKELHKEYSNEIREYFNQENVIRSDYTIPKQDPKLDMRMIEKFDGLCKRTDYYGHGNYLCFGIDNPAFIRDSGYVYLREEMFPPVRVIFEGDEYLTFRCWDSWLRNAYGDYWLFPHNLMTGHRELSKLTEKDYNDLVEHGVIRIDSLKKTSITGKKVEIESLDF